MTAPNPEQATPRILTIQKCVAAYYGLQPKDMASAQRARHITRPRMMAMFLSRQLTVHSYTAIAAAFNKDHSTVVHAVQTITAMLRQYPALRTEKDELVARISRARRSLDSGTLFLPLSSPASEVVNARAK